MSQLFEAAIQYLQADEWPVLLVPDQTVAVTRVQGDSGEWECQLRLREEQHQIVFYSICPLVVPADRRGAMAEFITRANYGLVLGNLEMDMDDGEVRYKTSQGLAAEGLPEMRSLIYANVLALDHFLPGIKAVLDGNLSPAVAVQALVTDQDSRTE